MNYYIIDSTKLIRIDPLWHCYVEGGGEYGQA